MIISEQFAMSAKPKILRKIENNSFFAINRKRALSCPSKNTSTQYPTYEQKHVLHPHSTLLKNKN